MADDNSGSALIVMIPLILLAVLAAIAFVVVLCSVGVIFGSGTAAHNYVRAFWRNVRLERHGV